MTIPNIFHFVYGLAEDFGGKPFSYVHYLAVKSALELNQPDKVFFICEYEPDTEWFDRLRPDMEVVNVTAPEAIYGNQLTNYAHKSDVIRLQCLMEFGGVYLDLDTISVKPLHDLRERSDFVIGAQLDFGFQGRCAGAKIRAVQWHLIRWQKLKARGVCNAVLMTEKDSEFLRVWYDEYRHFSANEDHDWDYHSVVLPWTLLRSGDFRASVVSPFHFHYPLWDEQGLADLFVRTHRFRCAYVHHLWESKSWDTYLSKISPQGIARSTSTYARLAKPFLEQRDLHA